MTRILDRLPPLPGAATIDFGERHVAFFRDSLLVWLSIGLRGEERLDRLSPAFPALFDTGNNHDCYLHEHHLVQWAGIRPAMLAVLGTRRINREPVPCHEGDVWIYPNQPGTYKRAEDKPPFRLRIEGGIAVRPTDAQHAAAVSPRVPLLGVAAARRNKLDWWFDSQASHFYLRTAGWRSKIIRLLQRF
jgi:hypothetical protein